MPAIEIELPTDRNRVGRLLLTDNDGFPLLGPYPVCGRANDFAASEHGNPTRSPLRPYGDTPTGQYRVRGFAATGAGTPYDTRKFGRSGMIVLEPLQSEAPIAGRNDGWVLLIHAGTPNPGSSLLYATNGSLRMYDNDLRELIDVIRGDPSLICTVRGTNEFAASPLVTLDPNYDEGDPPLAADQMLSGGARLIVCVSNATSGVRHRYRNLQQIKGFADSMGYSVRLLWGVTSGVSFCRHEELFDAIPSVEIENISHRELIAIGHRSNEISMNHAGETLRVLQPAEPPVDRFFAWDCPTAEALGKRVPGAIPPVVARLCPALQSQVDSYVAANSIEERLGIRVRVTEQASDWRRPRRLRDELNETLESLRQIPRHYPVFLATDSEYIQQALLSHFADARILPKNFDLKEETGGYVHRQDKDAMFTFLKEVGCLSACRQIISIGGFLNDRTLGRKIIREPYEKTLLP